MQARRREEKEEGKGRGLEGEWVLHPAMPVSNPDEPATLGEREYGCRAMEMIGVEGSGDDGTERCWTP